MEAVHHIAQPMKFFQDLKKVLKPGGLVLINEIHTSLIMRLLLKVMSHEGWSYDVDVFDKETVANDPRDPWSANCAIPQLLFREGFKVAGDDTLFVATAGKREQARVAARLQKLIEH